MSVRRMPGEIERQALSISLAVAPFGVAFGVAAADAGLSVTETVAYSTVVFSGSAQFAAVGVLGDGGGVLAAVVAGLLLNLRSLAFGVVMAPALRGPLWWRALVSHLMIDEATAVGSAQTDRSRQRYGYLWGGLGVFVCWNAMTAVGVSALSSAGVWIDRLGIDATIPAAFLALVWPRLVDARQRAVALLGGAIAFVLVPVAPAGVPIVASAAAVLVARPWLSRPGVGA